METGDLTTFKCEGWLSKTLGDKKTVKELAAIVKGKTQIKGQTILAVFQVYQRSLGS